jgi:hypothetical protein
MESATPKPRKPKPVNYPHSVFVRLNPEAMERLRSLAELDGKTISKIIRDLLNQKESADAVDRR